MFRDSQVRYSSLKPSQLASATEIQAQQSRLVSPRLVDKNHATSHQTFAGPQPVDQKKKTKDDAFLRERITTVPARDAKLRGRSSLIMGLWRITVKRKKKVYWY